MGPNNFTAIVAKDATTEQNSAVIDASFLFSGSIQAKFSANDAAGTLSLQFSDEPSNSLSGGIAPTNWNDVPSGTAMVASGALTSIFVPVLSYRWLKINWAPSGGSAGTVTANAFFFGY